MAPLEHKAINGFLIVIKRSLFKKMLLRIFENKYILSKAINAFTYYLSKILPISFLTIAAQKPYFSIPCIQKYVFFP